MVPLSLCQLKVHQSPQFCTCCYIKVYFTPSESVCSASGVFKCWGKLRKMDKQKILPSSFGCFHLYSHYILGFSPTQANLHTWHTHYLTTCELCIGFNKWRNTSGSLWLIFVQKLMKLLSVVVIYTCTCIPSSSLRVCIEHHHKIRHDTYRCINLWQTISWRCSR